MATSTWISFRSWLLVVALCICFSVIGHAQVSDTERLIQAGILERTNSYSYVIEGRADPFKSFISAQAAAPSGLDPNEIVDEDERLTGMQLFEPGQLTLVGIMHSPASEMAFVEDQAKKGYVLKVGTLVGRRGVVAQIDPDQVLIEETAKTRSGQEIITTVTMRLNKEGDR